MRIKQNSISGTAQWLMTLLIAVLVMGWSGTAWGQGAGAGSSSFTDSTTQSVVFNPPTTTTTNVNLFSTQIIGRIGGGTPLYNQTFAFSFSHPTAQAGVTAARAAITTAGGPGVIIGSPVRTASTSNTTTTSSTNYSLASTTQTTTTAITFGPDSILIGQRTVCNGISSLPSSTAPTCSAGNPTTYNLVNGETNFNINTATTFNINQATTTTNTTTLFEQYTITGNVRRIGSVHPLTTEAGGDATSLFAQRLRSVGDGELKRGFWFSGYGWFGKRSANGEIAGDNRHGVGVSGGFAASFGKGFRAGIGFDQGTTKLTLDTVGESGTVDLTQFGAHLDYDRKRFRVRFANANGRGNVNTQTAPADLNFSTTARYNLTTNSLSGEVFYALSLGKWNLTPNSGAEWRRVKNDGFSEAGTFGLVANAHTTNWSRGWAGMNLERTIGDGGLFKVYGRATFNGHKRVLMPVTFATLGGGTMQLESPDYGNIGSEFGTSVVVPVTNHFSLYAAYDARIRGNLTINNVSGGFKLVF